MIGLDGECNVDAMPRPGNQDSTYAGQGTQKEEASRGSIILRASQRLSAEQLRSRAFAIATSPVPYEMRSSSKLTLEGTTR
ncbi:hypothetical protein ALC57_18619 [Trachymyrmex cornetzi]|uniref:Uncharacterized protein n=1 Tax=Trachymyrmex cornetzi TaxID=471704 RepID=A0A151IRG3_9HYME|nr:hypothetical protein ALC57_18619 [Trachymyrmex cornetzi]